MPIFHYLFGSESPRREVYVEGLSMPGAGFLREHRGGALDQLYEMPGVH